MRCEREATQSNQTEGAGDAGLTKRDQRPIDNEARVFSIDYIASWNVAQISTATRPDQSRIIYLIDINLGNKDFFLLILIYNEWYFLLQINYAVLKLSLVALGHIFDVNRSFFFVFFVFIYHKIQ